MLRSVPRDIAFQATTIATVIVALMDARLMFATTFTVTIMTAIYVVFSYFGPLIEASFGINPEARTFYLVLFGIGAVIGSSMGDSSATMSAPATRFSLSVLPRCC